MMAKKPFYIGAIVQAKTNINTQDVPIKKGTKGKVVDNRLGFGSNMDFWYIKFVGHSVYEFNNYDKRFIEVLS